MKKFYVITGFLLSSSLMASAQHNELSAQLGSGLFSFRGNRVVQESFFNIGRESLPPKVGSASYTNDPWSSRSSFSWSIAMQVQHVARNNFITGLQLAYESLATKTKIIGGSDLGQFITFQQGSSTFTYTYANLHPFAGYRFGNRQLSLDITAGLDVAVGLYNWEKGKGTATTGDQYITSHKHAIPRFDLRPRLNATAYYHTVGLGISYAHGLTDYSANLVGMPTNATTTQLWRINAIYRFAH